MVREGDAADKDAKDVKDAKDAKETNDAKEAKAKDNDPEERKRGKREAAVGENQAEVKARRGLPRESAFLIFIRLGLD